MREMRKFQIEIQESKSIRDQISRFVELEEPRERQSQAYEQKLAEKVKEMDSNEASIRFLNSGSSLGRVPSALKSPL